MFFEGAMRDTQNATSPEEFQQRLRPHLNPGKISEKRLLECLEEIFPYYNTGRLQRGLGVLTPFEKHEQYLAA